MLSTGLVGRDSRRALVLAQAAEMRALDVTSAETNYGTINIPRFPRSRRPEILV